jgi:hypothetical protein
MAKRSARSSANSKSNRKTTPLGLEQLETRMMNAFSGIEQNLNVLLGPNLGGSTQMVSALTTNAAPTVASPAKLQSAGTEIRGVTANVSVKGADDAGELNLTYTWYVAAKPLGANVQFQANGTNESKANTLSFDRAGNYSIGVTIRDRNGLTTTSTLQFNVVQTLTSLKLMSMDRVNLAPNQALATSGTSQQVRIQGFDQFGNAMASTPNIVWARQSASNGGNVSVTQANDIATVTFSKTGTYVVQAKFGSVTASYTANVIPTLTSILVKNAENRTVAGSGTTINATSQRWIAVGLDQFNTPLTEQPKIAWSKVSSPAGSSLALDTSGEGVNVTFNRAGAYQLMAQSGATSFRFSVTVNAVLTTLGLSNPNGQGINPEVAIRSAGTSTRLGVQGFDQFNQPMATLPALTWSTTGAPRGGAATGTLSGGITTISFTRAGDYAFRVRGGNANLAFQITVVQTLTSIVGISADDKPLATGTPISSQGTDITLRARGLDQFGQPLSQQPTNFAWTTTAVPNGATANFKAVENGINVGFNRAGLYSLRVSSGGALLSLNVRVAQTLTSITLTPGTASVAAGATKQFEARGLDQFQQPITSGMVWAWSANGGTVTNSGLFTAGTVAGNFAVVVKSGSLTASAAVTVTKATPADPLNNTALKNLIQTLYADNSISRADMIQILRSTGDDGSVSASELADLQFLVTAGGSYAMPSYVRELARDVVVGNVANRTYQGTALGNLAAGSTAAVLNKLVDKWFLGSDTPTLTNSNWSYQVSAGSLFNGSPTHNDARQGQLGDCYFIAALSAIADKNADAVRNMFIDNGDGTYTVRFYAGAGVSVGSGTADYVTVNRKLPTNASGNLVYSSYGMLASSASTPLWIALAEKAYAQWNETGKSGRNGTNSYGSIEGGWMGDVNAQVLGYRSSDYALSSTNKQVLVNALTTGRSVTIGTNGNTSFAGLYGSHAYIVTGYNASNDTFTLYNPWGFMHPAPMSWLQIQSNCSFFVTTDSAGTTPINVNPVRFSVTDTLIGNWTTIVSSSTTAAARLSHDVENLSQANPMSLIDGLTQQVDEVASEWITIDDQTSDSSSLGVWSKAEGETLDALNAMAVDLAMGMEHLDSILG